MRVRPVQQHCRPADPLAACLRAINAAAGCDLVVLPELALSGRTNEPGHLGPITLDGAELRQVAVAAAATGCAVVARFAERHSGGVSNSLAAVDGSGLMVGCYRKTHLFGAAERACFQEGEELLCVELGGRRVGMLTCFDVEFPEPARALAQAGAELLVCAAANMAPHGGDHVLATAARALDNRRPLIYANFVGTWSATRFVGGSRAVGPDGQVLAAAGDEPDVVDAVLAFPTDTTGDTDYLAHLRPPLPVRVLDACRV